MLPKIEYPSFEATVPSTGKVIRMRPMLVKEEKILLIAKEDGTGNAINQAILQILNNCIVTQGINVENFTLFDVEFLFVKLRGVSIGNVIKVTYRDAEDEKNYDFEINTDDIKPPLNIKKLEPLTVSETVKVLLRYPPASVYYSKEILESKESEVILKILLPAAVDKIIDGDKVHERNSFTQEEIGSFIENLDLSCYNVIRDQVLNFPRMEHVLKYKNSLGNERTITLASIEDFFML